MLKKASKNFWLTVITPIVIFWSILYALDYPPPMIDDLFFTGAGINLAQKGEFVNPWLAMWSDRTLDRFFVQPPFYPYALAGWLWVFGISTKSLLLFQWLCYNVFSIFAALLLKLYRFSHIAIFACVILFSFWMFQTGFRQDAMGMSCLALGLWLLAKDTIPRYFFGFIFLGISTLTAPVMIAYSVSLGGAILIANYFQFKGKSSKYLGQRLLVLGGAIGVVFTLFLLCIDFQLSQFFADLGWHASLRRQPWYKTIPTAIWLVKVGYGEIIYGSLYSLYVALGVWFIVKRKQVSITAQAIVLALTIGLGLNIFTYVATLPNIFNFFCGLGIILMLTTIPWTQRYKTLIYGLTIAIFFINNSLNAIALLGREEVPSTTYETVKAFVAQHPQQIYVIDNVAARFIFDYRLPDGAIDWSFSNGSDYFWPTSIADKKPNTVWIVSPSRGMSAKGLPDYPRVQFWGRQFESIPSKPHDLVIIE